MEQTDENKDILIDRLIDLAGHAAIVHHIPGRIRLKVKLQGLLIARDLDAADLVKYFNGIQDVRANAAARSIVIGYDHGVITPDFWERLVDGKMDLSLRNLVREQLKSFFKPGIV